MTGPVYYRFRVDSVLCRYLKYKKHVKILKKFTLPYLINMISDLVANEMMDSGNESIIFCYDSLSHALDVRALHITQLQEYVTKHLILVAPVTNQPDDNSKCVLKFDLRSILCATPFFPSQQYEFTFKEIYWLFNSYMYYNCLVDKRNTTVCIVKDDPLGQLFNLKAFHKSQMIDLILKHISIIK